MSTEFRSDNDSVRFEACVSDLFRALGFELEQEPFAVRSRRPDMVVKGASGAFAVEVKFYRTEQAQISLLEAAVAQLAVMVAQTETVGGVLVASCAVQPITRRTLEKRTGIVLVDRKDLVNWSSPFPDLLERLSAILGLDASSLLYRKPRSLDKALLRSLSSGASPASPDVRGTELCAELRSVETGNPGWSAYEKLCDKILRYLFPNDLHGWRQQQRTDDGLNRFDYVCRIKGVPAFWKFLCEQLGSQYVLFEFKNYTDPITQGQILTTEKYLLERGLRRVAIILSRRGADKNATSMAQGAMRENGKLLLVLDDEKLCEMLHMKERGEDPSDFLFEIADDFFLSLPR